MDKVEQMIQAKGMIAPRVTPEDVHNNIKYCYYFTAAEGIRGSTPSGLRTNIAVSPTELLTFCVLVLQNGYVVTGESACASPENFDAEIGKTIAKQNAMSKVWGLMGYALKEELAKQ